MKKKSLALVLTLAMAFTACSTDWVVQVQNIVTLALPAVTNILMLIAAFSGKGVDPAELATVQAIGQEVNSDLSQVKSLIDEYKAAPDDQKASKLAKISEAVKVAQGHLGEILPALHLKNAALQAKVTAIVNLVYGELVQVAAIVDAARGSVAASAVAQAPSAKQFKHSFNAAMYAPSADPNVDSVAAGLGLK